MGKIKELLKIVENTIGIPNIDTSTPVDQDGNAITKMSLDNQFKTARELEISNEIPGPDEVVYSDQVDYEELDKLRAEVYDGPITKGIDCQCGRINQMLKDKM